MNIPANAPGYDRLSRPMAGRQLGRYEILTQLASGGMASVYIARSQGVAGFERLVAIKVLHPHLAYEQEFISMFLDEARLAARIRHTNVVSTLDVSDSPGDGYFLVMDYIEGNHFGALLGRAAQQGELLPRPFVFRVLIDALHGLAAAHRLADEDGTPLKLVHRDVSPHNILVGTDGISRLTDFGVAKADVRMASTRAGQFKGKLAYMAPEQAASSETDQRSDLFSIGIILWESLTGRRLFRGDSNAATLNKLLNDTIAQPSSLGSELEPYDEVVMKALSRNPDHRHQTAEELIEALDAVAGRRGIAKTRDVAEVVRTLDVEHLEDQRERVHDAIELLGRVQFAELPVPMPRDSLLGGSQMYDRPHGASAAAEAQASGMTSDGAPVVVRPAESPIVLRWLVTLLAILVFLYAGFLVWETLGTPSGPRTTEPASVQDTAGMPARPDALSPTPDSPRSTADTESTPTDDGSTTTPERKNSTEAVRPPRRKPTSRGEPRRRSRDKSSARKKEAPAEVDPLDIDIDNPYRN